MHSITNHFKTIYEQREDAFGPGYMAISQEVISEYAADYMFVGVGVVLSSKFLLVIKESSLKVNSPP